jgi:hypothetical protein
MKNIVISLSVITALFAFSGCAPKKSCNTAKKVKKVEKPAPKVKEVAPVVVKPAPAPVIVEEKEVEVIEAPVYDSKESSVR